MDIVGIGYLGFESAKLSEWRDYGPEVMAFSRVTPPDADPESLYFKMDERRYRLAFHPGAIDRLAYIGWEARGRMEFLDAISRFEAAGVALERGDSALAASRGVREVIRFKDPVGFQHELFYGQKYEPGSYIPPRQHGGFNTSERGMCHMVVMTPEYTDELEHFLTDLMGFAWYGSGAGKGRTGFFRAKLNDKTSHDIAYGHAPGRRGIQHLGIFMSSIRDVGQTYDIVQKRQLPMMFTLGQHIQDPHLSFYHFTPSGFAIETIYEVEPWHHEKFEANPEKLSSWGHQLVGPVLGPSVRNIEELGEVA
jgi:2,3-dihydroxybiphenyl 1,2-dioxygenase